MSYLRSFRLDKERLWLLVWVRTTSQAQLSWQEQILTKSCPSYKLIHFQSKECAWTLTQQCYSQQELTEFWVSLRLKIKIWRATRRRLPKSLFQTKSSSKKELETTTFLKSNHLPNKLTRRTRTNKKKLSRLELTTKRKLQRWRWKLSTLS